MAESLSFLLCPVRKLAYEQETEDRVSSETVGRADVWHLFNSMHVRSPLINAMGKKAYVKDDVCGLSLFNPIHLIKFFRSYTAVFSHGRIIFAPAYDRAGYCFLNVAFNRCKFSSMGKETGAQRSGWGRLSNLCCAGEYLNHTTHGPL